MATSAFLPTLSIALDYRPLVLVGYQLQPSWSRQNQKPSLISEVESLAENA